MRLFYLFFCIVSSVTMQAQVPDHLFQIEELAYVGAFRVPASDYGVSDLNFSEGPIAYNPANNSIFLVGHTYQQSVAEFSIPALDIDTDISSLNMATNLQPFVSYLDVAECPNTQHIDRIGGIAVINNQLFINTYEYYDADANGTYTTLVVENPAALATSEVRGYFQLEGGVGHTAGWMSPIPEAWQDTIGHSHITGFSSGIPIISRASVGPTAFAFTPDVSSLECGTGVISTERLLDFSLSNPLNEDLDNSSLENDVWTFLSRATFGMIIPGTKTYLTIGQSGGFESGVCYKCVQSDDNLCGGYCAPQSEDYSQFYWLWDMDDLLRVKAGLMNSYDVRPYSYGPMAVPFASRTTDIGGGTYDAQNGIMYLTLKGADREQGTYANPPVVVGYKFALRSNDCNDEDMVVSTELLPDNMDIKSRSYIKSDALISATADIVIWSAKEYIELLTPFEIAQGLRLTLSIEDCNN